MDFTLSAHAEQQMGRRQIAWRWVQAIMQAPEQIVTGTNNRKVYQSRIVEDGGAYLVRLIVEAWRQPPHIVTVYRTSKIEKYWSTL